MSNGVTDAFCIATMKALRDLGKPTDTTLSLEALRLCGLHLAPAILYDVPKIHFMNSTTLTIESYFNMHSAFEQLTARGAINLTTTSKMRLKSFYLRHENFGIRVDGDIEQLLSGLRGPPRPPGRSWPTEVRTSAHPDKTWADPKDIGLGSKNGPRMKAEKSTTVHAPRLFYLDCISQYCQKLVALRISIDWDFVYQPKNHARVPYSEPHTVHNTY